MATGADKAFIGDFDTMDVEADRKVPLVTTRDILSGEVKWRGQGVINPFRETVKPRVKSNSNQEKPTRAKGQE